jgi:hypothetical protein
VVCDGAEGGKSRGLRATQPLMCVYLAIYLVTQSGQIFFFRDQSWVELTLLQHLYYSKDSFDINACLPCKHHGDVEAVEHWIVSLRFKSWTTFAIEADV